MLPTSIQLDPTLLDRVQKRAAARGVSVRAYVEAVLERELARAEDSEGDEAVRRKLEQLGYIDAGMDI
jgi:hypothetical protein